MLKTFRALTYLSLLLIFSLGNLPLAAQQQSPQRERRVGQTPSPSPTPPAEVEEPTPTPTPEAVRPSTTTQTLEQLRSRISQVLARPELSPAMVGIKVASLDTGRLIFEA